MFSTSAFIALSTLCCVLVQAHSMDDPDFILFQNYLFQHGKAYDEGLLEKRFSAFRQNLVLIEQQNAAEKAAGGTAVYGLTEFSDLTPEEFNNLYLTHNMDAGKPEILVDPESYVGSSTSVNWFGVLTAPVIRYQGGCGSCYAVSTVEQVESDSIRLLGLRKNVQLSAQQVTSCSDPPNLGCGGGTVNNAYGYMANGIAPENSYPYTSASTVQTGACTSNPSNYIISVPTYQYLSQNEAAIANYLLTTGPLNAQVCATSWPNYVSGVVTQCGTCINHAVQIVGIDLVNNYYIVSNCL